MSAQVTEAHLELAKTVIFSRDSAGRLLTAPMGAQLIADSEAKAKWSLLAAYDAVVAQRNRVTTERDQLRAECLNLRADLDAIKAIRDEEKARADEAEHDCRVLIGQLNDALAELADIRALANRRNKSDHSQDTTHQLVAALDQALDIAQAELATERARLDWLMAGGVCMVQHSGGFYVSRLHAQVSRAAIDSGMKEVAK